LRSGVGWELGVESGVPGVQSAGDLAVSRRSDLAVVAIDSDGVVVGVRRESIARDGKILPSDVARSRRNGSDSGESSVLEVLVGIEG